MVAVIDYDAGNVRNVLRACEYLGNQTVLTRDPDVILHADHVILPGVGAFGDAMEHLERFGLVPAIKETAAKGTPFLGICLGLQLLFSESEESPGVQGLGLLEGRIRRIPKEDGIKVPHMGWNSLELLNDGRMFAGCTGEPYVYFVHSYYLQAQDPSIVTAAAQYGSTRIQAAVEKDNMFACQFHPEKSSAAGLSMLKRFLQI